jgi:hypothetical protein
VEARTRNLEISKERHPQAWAHVQVFLDANERGSLPAGLPSLDDLLMMSPAAFVDRPWLFDVLLPCELPTAAASLPPALDEVQAMVLLAEPSLKPRYTSAYIKFVALHDLVVDHHGWLFDGERPTPDTSRLRALLLTDPPRAARALRFLTHLNLQGYSQTNYWSGAALDYASCLLKMLRKQWTLAYGSSKALPASWLDAVRPSAVVAGT